MYKETESKIENTLFEARTAENGKILSYRIRPAKGYKLHESTLDESVVDEYGNETGEIKLGYTESYVTAGAGYDFEKNDRQIYAEEVKNEYDN